MKKALTLRKGRIGTQTGPTMKVAEVGQSSRSMSSKHLSLHAGALKSLRSGASKSESLFLLGDPEFAVNQGEVKEARLHHYNYYEETETLGRITLRGNVDIRTQNVPGFGASGKKGTLRASLMKSKKDSGELVLGEGRLQFNLKSGKALKFEVGKAEHIVYRSLKSKDFAIKFHGDSRAFTVKCQSPILAQNWVRSIFIEVRSQCAVLSRCLASILPEDWSQALQTSSKLKDAPDETMLTVMENNEKEAAEICLREMVDLIRFSRGSDNMEYFEICEKFAKWLIKNGKAEEAKFWEETVEKGLQTHEEKRQKELNGDGTFLGQKLDERKDVIEGIRNPVKLSDVAEMRAKSIPENLDERVNRMQRSLMCLADNVNKVGDKYEALI